MGHHETTVKEDMGIAVRGFIVLLIVTFIEVGIALFGNGHIIEGHTWYKFIMIPLMIFFSLYKAYYIVGTFMHLGHETRPMAASVVLPMLLFVWAITAFLWEGWSWRTNQNYVDDKNKEAVKSDVNTGDDKKEDGHSSIIKDSEEMTKEVSFH